MFANLLMTNQPENISVFKNALAYCTSLLMSKELYIIGYWRPLGSNRYLRALIANDNKNAE